MASVLDFFLSFQNSFMLRAFFSAIVIGVVCSIIGVFVLLRGMIFLGQAIAHSAFAGASLAVLLGMDNPIITIIGFSLISAVGIGFVNQKQIMNNEIIIGIVFSFFMALAVLFIGLHGEYSSDINSILFGNILLVDSTDFILLMVFSLVILVLIFLIKKELYFITFDNEQAKISGIPVTYISYLFLVVVSLTISVSLKAIGAILVFAMIVTPAATAHQWTYKLNKMILLSVIFGVISSILGLFLSYIFDLPSGSTIVSLLTITFLISFILSPKRRSARKGQLECPFCKNYLTGPKDVCTNDECEFFDIPHFHEKDSVKIERDQIPIKKTSKHPHDLFIEENNKEEKQNG
ncbi:MAG: metal ABC transporter permease [Asgard group archaeon]|nr:metal ABC transporter permease [Asgard group archaeon]